MCNTQSKVYLQSMKTYTLSVNILTWNLTSERHDNCAPCLGLILPIRWVTPPPNFLVWSVSLMALLLNIFAFDLTSKFQLIFMIYFTRLIWLLFHIYISIYIYTSILSSTAFTYKLCLHWWIFWTKWMWSDPNLSMLTISNSICSNHMHSIETVECLLCILVSRRHRDKH